MSAQTKRRDSRAKASPTPNDRGAKEYHLVHRQSRRQDNFVYLKFVTTDQLVNEIERQ